MVFKKIIFQNSLMANETPSRPPPFMANAILNFHFDFLHPSLSQGLDKVQIQLIKNQGIDMFHDSTVLFSLYF